MDSRKQIQLAYDYYQKDRLHEALQILNKILEEEPENTDALFYLGVVHHRFGNNDDAVANFRKIIEINPHDADVLNNLGIILQGKGQYDQAIIYYRKAVELKPQLCEAFYNLGTLLVIRNETDEAIACFRSALQLDPRLYQAYTALAVIFQKRGQHKEAIEHYTKALQFDPNNADIYVQLGVALYNISQTEESRTYFEKALQLNQDLAEPYLFLGMILKEKKEYTGAIANFQEALQRDSGLAWACMNLSAVFHYQGAVKKSEEYFCKAIEMSLAAKKDCQSMGFAIRGQEESYRLKDYTHTSCSKPILIVVNAFNRKRVTKLSLEQTQRYMTSYCCLQVYNDHSTEYDNTFLSSFANEVIQLPEKLGVDSLRWHQFGKFLETDFEFLYMTDNDVMHDPHYIAMLEAFYQAGEGSMPVSLYNSIFTMQPKMILYYKNGILLKTTAPGLSMFYDRKMVKKILETKEENADKDTGYLPWDNKAVKRLGLPWITPDVSYLEHFGAEGINNANYERDRAINPTQYLQRLREPVLEYLSHDIEKGLVF